MRELETDEEIVYNCKNISEGYELLVNNRKRKIIVEQEYNYYKRGHEIQKFYTLEGNGTKYLLVIYRKSSPRLYTKSDFSVEEVNYTEGTDFSTNIHSSEKVRSLSINRPEYCYGCDFEKLYDSSENSYYCPLCEV